MAEKIFKGDKTHKAIMSYFENGRVRFDTFGIIGENSARKTEDYLKYIADESEEKIMKTVEDIMSMPKEYHGRLDNHHDGMKKVIIYDNHDKLYVKGVVASGILWIDVHLHYQ